MSVALRHFVSPGADVTVRQSLVCFGHAGAGATPFARWRGHLPGWLDLYAYVPPGREERIGQPPLRSIADLVAEVKPDVAGLPGQLVLVGHSFGAWLAYELAHPLASQGGPPTHLVVLAAAPPGRMDLPDIRDDHDIETLWARLGADTSRLANPRLRELVFPALRADLAAQIAYRPPRPGRLTVPITVLYGDRDPSVTAAEATGWRALCAGECRTERVSGGHFFPRDSVQETVSVMVRALHG